MDEIKTISQEEFTDIAAQQPFNTILLTKDYFLTTILYLLKDIDGLYFKGGTALQKIFLNYSRLSEDIDYTVTIDMDEAKKKIKNAVKLSPLVTGITKDKDVEGFTRFIVRYDFHGQEGTIFIDLNKRAKLLLKPEKQEVKHVYSGFIPAFSVPTLAKEEMIAEKVAAAIGRNRPRDHYDIYQIIKRKIQINLKLVEKKCKQSGYEFDIVNMFNRANKLKTRWDRDMLPLLSEEVPFTEVMKRLSDYFKLKEAKEKQRKNNAQ